MFFTHYIMRTIEIFNLYMINSRIILVNKENEAKKRDENREIYRNYSCNKKNYDHFETKERKFLQKKTVQNIVEDIV